MDNIQTTLERLLLIGTTLLQLANNNTLITPIGPEQGAEQGRVPVTIENLQNLLNALNKLNALSSKDIRNKLSKIDNIIDTNINNDAELTRQLGEYGFVIIPDAIFIRMQEPLIAQAAQPGIQAVQPGIQAAQEAAKAAQEAINSSLEAINVATTAAENTRHAKEADSARAGAQHAQDALNQATAPAFIPQTEAQAQRSSLSSSQQAERAAHFAKQAAIIAQKAGEEKISAILPRGPQAARTLTSAGIIQTATLAVMLAAEQAQRVPNEQKTLLISQIQRQALLAEQTAEGAIRIAQALTNGTAFQAEGLVAHQMLQGARDSIQAASAIQGQPEAQALEYARAIQEVSLAAYTAANLAARTINPQAEQAQLLAERAAKAEGLAAAAAARAELAATRAQIALGIPQAQELHEAIQAKTRAEVASEVAKMVVDRAQFSRNPADREPKIQANILAELAILAAKQAILAARQITQGTIEERTIQIAEADVLREHQAWLHGAPPGQSVLLSSEASLEIAKKVTLSAHSVVQAAARLAGVFSLPVTRQAAAAPAAPIGVAAASPPAGAALGGPASPAGAAALGGPASPAGAAALGGPASPVVVAVSPVVVAASPVVPPLAAVPPVAVAASLAASPAAAASPVVVAAPATASAGVAAAPATASAGVPSQLDPPAPVEEATTNILQTLQNVNEVSIFTDTTIIKKLLKLDNTTNIDQLEDSFRTNFNIIITDEGISINIAN